MSCTENESGPFVVFFLPAVVGCLTILLARRWASSQTAISSTTAVSRRRKIIKDPLFKRTMPPLTVKITPKTSKKVNAVCTKGLLINGEEELANGMKRLNRSAKSPLASNTNGTSEAKVPEGHMAPKHIPFPYIPQDGELMFEFMSFMFMVLAVLLQFHNLYKTNWWLEDSRVTELMHYYLIDTHLVAFILMILSRRLLLSLCAAVLRLFVGNKQWPQVAIALRMFVLGVVIGALAWCTYFIALKYPLFKLIYLCYPVIVYLALFGLQSAPFLELGNYSDMPLLHNCSTDPKAIRAEVDLLRKDFNLRLNKILFNSLMGAYYSSFIPVVFAQSIVYYSRTGPLQQTALVWGALACRDAAQLLCATTLDTHHRTTLHLASWTPRPHAGGNTEHTEWRGDRLWPRGARVTYCGRHFVADALTAAEPGDKHHFRFHTIFKNPSNIICGLLCLQSALILVQLTLLFVASPWQDFLALFLLLFINYYTIFKLIRDYLVAWKVYKAEIIVHEKTNQTAVT